MRKTSLEKHSFSKVVKAKKHTGELFISMADIVMAGGAAYLHQGERNET